jgi:hypothetical protein
MDTLGSGSWGLRRPGRESLSSKVVEKHYQSSGLGKGDDCQGRIEQKEERKEI